MTIVAIDFGTSRTAFAFFSGDEHAMMGPRDLKFRLPSAAMDPFHDALGGYPAGLDVLRTGLRELGVGRVAVGKETYFSLFSQYAQMGRGTGRIAFPYAADRGKDWDGLGGDMTLVPEASTSGASGFDSVKTSPRQFAPLLNALIQTTCPWDDPPATTIVGWSAGVRETPEKLLGIPRALHYNEAIAVAFQLAFAHSDPAIRSPQGADVLVADLGGGYLDVALVTGMRFSDGKVDATVASYGGYPIGVDRRAARFSGVPVSDPNSFVRQIGLAAACHIVDLHARKEKVPASIKLALTGGGFRRLGDEKVKDRIVKEIGSILAAERLTATITDTWSIPDDTKYLTLKGLKLLNKFQFHATGAAGESLSSLDPFEARERFSKILAGQAGNVGASLGELIAAA